MVKYILKEGYITLAHDKGRSIMKAERNSGILMHISSLPGEYGIGSLGYEARQFVDIISEAGFTYWQVLPLSPTDECNSPYKSGASFGGNPYFIDLPTLYEFGLITSAELAAARQNTPYTAEYDRLKIERLHLLKSAAARVLDRTPIIEYIDARPHLSAVAHFHALREANGTDEWQSWKIHECDIDILFAYQFIEYEFDREWHALKEYANSRGVRIIGDLPMYVALSSADVWAEPSEFLLDERGYPTDVAGVPPDYFAEEGQLWGNPLYNWQRMRADGYGWWRRRIEHAFDMFDGVRIDHFRALEAYWAVPAEAKSAKCGRWVKGPGRRLVDLIRRVAADKLIIAEDLGDITDKVRRLVDYSRFPGMRVLQFSFIGEGSIHLPHKADENTIFYTGTHDNNTLLGYIWEADKGTRARLFEYVGADDSDWQTACDKAIRTLFATRARTVILPIQDILGFGADTRMNTPGLADGNWGFRLSREALASFDTERWKRINKIYER